MSSGVRFHRSLGGGTRDVRTQRRPRPCGDPAPAADPFVASHHHPGMVLGADAALLVTHDRPALRVHADPETRDALWYRGRDSGMNGPLRGGAPVVTLDQHG